MPRLSSFSLLKIQASQYQYLLTIANERKILPNGTASFRAFCYIVVSYCQQYHRLRTSKDDMMPLPASLMRQHFRGWSWKELRDKGLLLVDDFFSVRGRISMRYKPHPEIIDGFLNSASYDPAFNQYVILRDGKAWPEGLEEHHFGTHDKQEKTELVQQAIEIFKVCYFHHGRVLAHLSRLQEAVNQYRLGSKERKSAQGRLHNDQACYLSILKRLPSAPDEKGICSFSPLYRELQSGRIGMDGGGFQSASKAMKLAAFGSLENWHNYDLSASQPRICLEEFRKSGIECEWLSDYLKHYQTRKAEYAKYIGISENCWKDCLIPLLMGASLPRNTSSYSNGAILDVLRETGLNGQELTIALRRLREIVKPLMKPLEQWHELEVKKAEKHGYAINALGKRLLLEEMCYPKSEVAAHILQGAESLFIHHLTLLGPKYDYLPLQNEFDGLITLGKIPAMALREAETMTGLRYFELEEKPSFGISSSVK